ncbi:MAG: NAD(P)-binding domain-containing protein [Rhodothermaceae bacterium]|nr:NAD(P)-binding domain-containing protein [Rhodothermaceae bacterium]
MDTLIIWGIALVLAAVTSIPFLIRRRRTEQHAHEAAAKAREYNLHEPVSLYPIVDPGLCAGCGACVDVCPEGDVLALIGMQAEAIAPARCVGHGMCERACPTDAISLVFGTAQRGVELPRVRENYETNVPGLYIVGELGGMGLVRNAFEQARQCVERIARENRPASPGILDAVIIGAGPAGLSATINAKQHGLDTVTLEKEPDLGGTVRHYPRRKLVMNRAFTVPGYGTLDFTEIRKEELIAHQRDMVEKTGVEIQTSQTVDRIERLEGDGFVVHTKEGEAFPTQRVILAIGRRGTPRKLGIPGEDREGVYYSLAEPEHFAGRRLLVVGGGDSAVEAAMMLADQPGTTVHLSYRKDALARVKPGNLDRFQAAVAAVQITPLWSTNLTRIEADAIAYTDAEGTEHTLPNDDVFIFIGGELPTKFLQACGIAMDTHFGTPRAA